MSFLLVLAAAVTLVVGLLQSGLTLIYLSIGCSVVAGLVLAIAVLRGRPEPKAAPYEPARPYSPPPPAPTPSYSTPSYSMSEPEPADESWRVDTPVPAARRFGRPAPVAVEEPEPEPEPAPIAGYARRAVGTGTPAADFTSEMVAPAPRAESPIPDYDSLRAPEVLRRLEELDAAQLEDLRAIETAGKNRTSILTRIDARLETVREPGWDIDEAAWEGAEPAAEVEEVAVAEDDLDGGEDFEDEVVAEEEPEPEPEPEPAPAAAVAGDGFPIADYDGLRVGQILPLLRNLDGGQLEEVRQYEAGGKARSGILDRIDFLAAGGTRPMVTSAAAPPPPPPAAPAAEAAPATKAAPAAKAAGTTSIAAAVAAAKAKQQAKKG